MCTCTRSHAILLKFVSFSLRDHSKDKNKKERLKTIRCNNTIISLQQKNKTRCVLYQFSFQNPGGVEYSLVFSRRIVGFHSPFLGYLSISWHLPCCVARNVFLICYQILSVFHSFYFLGVHVETLCKHLIFCT